MVKEKIVIPTMVFGLYDFNAHDIIGNIENRDFH